MFIMCLVIQSNDKIMDVVRETARLGKTRFLTGVVIFSPFAQPAHLPRKLRQTNIQLSTSYSPSSRRHSARQIFSHPITK